MEFEDYRKAGEIAKKTVKYAKEIIKKGELLREIADKIENKIQELGGFPAFPVNLSIDHIAAHHTPSSDSDEKASGLLKIDLGVSVDGYIVDTAFTIDLEDTEENKKLIQASEQALQKALEFLKSKPDTEIWEIGKTIQDTITGFKFSPIRNLSGHSLEQYSVHAGITIPNYNNNNKNKLQEGAYAIEPFSTTGEGKVYEGKPSGIYKLQEKKPIRDKKAREILEYIEKQFNTLPFCERQINKKFQNSKTALKFLENSEIIKQYSELVEKSHKPVSHSETSLILSRGEVEVLV